MITLFIVHFVADFLLQSRKMGKLKSTSWGYLGAHLLIQFVCFAPFLGLGASLINAAVHGLIDRNIWNAYKAFAGWQYDLNEENGKEFRYWEDHWFFVTIGLDQLLHGITLILIFTYL